MSAEPVLSARAKPSPGGLDEAPNYTASLKHNVKVLDFIKSGGPSGIRTLDTRIKSPVLFQAELTAHIWLDTNYRPGMAWEMLK